MVGEEHIPISVACSAVGLSRASYYKRSTGLREKDQIVIDALNQVVGKNGRWGFGLCFAYLRNLGAPWNHRRVWRITTKGSPFRDKEMGLNLPRRTRKRLPKMSRVPLIAPNEPNTMWALVPRDSLRSLYVRHLALRQTF